MKCFTKFISIIILTVISFTNAQEADLILQTDITPAYENMLRSTVAQCDILLQNPAPDAATMKTYAKRAIIHMALIPVDNKNFRNSSDELGTSMENNGERFENWLEMYIGPVNFDNIDSMLIDLKDLFIDPTFIEMRNEFVDIRDQYSNDFDSLGSLIEDYIQANAEHVNQTLDDLRAINDYQIPFQFSLQILGAKSEEIMPMTETDFYDLDSVFVFLEEGLELLMEAGSKLDSLQNDLVSPEEMVEAFREAIGSVNLSLDKLEEVLTTEPLSIVEPDTSYIPEIRNFLAIVDSIFAGKEYELQNEGKTIRPVALLENSFESYGRIIENFYKSANRSVYTFGNLFPNGLPSDAVERLEEKMVLNSNDGDWQNKARMIQLRNYYLDVLKTNPDKPEAHLGVALTKMYLYMKNLEEELVNFVLYLDVGDFREKFQWMYLSNETMTDSIRDHFEMAKTDEDLVFTILMLDNNQEGNYQILENTGIVPTFILHEHLELVGGLAGGLAEARDEIWEGIDSIYSNLDKMFDLDLDPNYLDFSSVESELDFLNVLEQANPNFLDITPYGEEKFLEAGDELREAFSRLAVTSGHFREFMNAVSLQEDVLDIDGEGIRDFSAGFDDFVNEVNTDFQVPDSTTWFDDTRVNLSAWFDNPPHYLLLRLKWYFDDDELSDNTMGGLFPDRGGIDTTSILLDSYTSLPNEYKLYQNYPNPFNPSTTITFALPQAELVRLSVHNILGEQVAKLIDGRKEAGYHRIQFNAKKLATGLYIYKFQAGSYFKVKKFLFIK